MIDNIAVGVVKGGDYKVKDIVGSDIILNNGGIVSTIPFVKGYSTTSIIDYILKINSTLS